jgi:arylsulfatase A-like enzyme
MKVEQDTLVWFTSDNGGLPKIKPSSTGGLRDFKGSLYEGGIRVPAIIEWPQKINKFRVTGYPAGAVDIFPTIAEIVGLPDSSMHQPQDGQSLIQLLEKEMDSREKPLVFRSRARMAVIDNGWKILSQPRGDRRKIELFNLDKDPSESNDLFHPSHEQVTRLRKILVAARTSIDQSVAGKDYPQGKVLPQPPRIFWTEVPEYQKYFQEWKKRPEYESRLRKIK